LIDNPDLITMPDWLNWITTMENSKPLALLIFLTTFIAIVIYVYTGKGRKERLESYKNIPFADDADDSQHKDEQGKSS
jgi:cbb3-type cytochrome oxidase subunit 3